MVIRLSALILACAPQVGVFPRSPLFVHFQYPAFKARDFSGGCRVPGKTVRTTLTDYLVWERRLEVWLPECLTEHLSQRATKHLIITTMEQQAMICKTGNLVPAGVLST